ncbi:hypothetical protein IWX47DRAFT_913919 [Phyllosticta citricarpa]
MILPTTIIVAIAAVGVVALLLVLTALLCAGYTPTYCVSSVRKRLEAFRDRRQGDPEGGAVDSGVELPQYPGRADSTQPSPLPPPTPSLPPPARLPSSRLPPSSPPPMDTPVSRSRAVNSPRRASSPVFAFMSPPTPAPRDRARSRPRKTVLRPDIIRARAFVAASQVSYMSMIAPRCNTLTSAGRLQVDVGKASNYDCAAGK